MILHPLVSDQINREFLQALGNQSLECFLVGVLEKDRLPRIATIQGMINSSCFVSTWWSGHERAFVRITEFPNREGYPIFYQIGTQLPKTVLDTLFHLFPQETRVAKPRRSGTAARCHNARERECCSLKVTKRAQARKNIEDQAQIRARAALPVVEDRRASKTPKKEIPSVGKK